MASSSAIFLSVDLDCSLKSSQKNPIERLIFLISDSFSDCFGVSGVAGSWGLVELMCEMIVSRLITVTAPTACHFVPLCTHRDTECYGAVALFKVGAVR